MFPIGQKNNNNKNGNEFFQNTVIITSNSKVTKKGPQIIKEKLKSFIDKYNWEGINYLPENDD